VRPRSYVVHARWNEESRTWWTDGEDIPGLTCQAASFEQLVDTVFALAPELLRDNGLLSHGVEVPISVIAARTGTAHLVA
jgi:hypothetical protein